jgi:hypothetical protein
VAAGYGFAPGLFYAGLEPSVPAIGEVTFCGSDRCTLAGAGIAANVVIFSAVNKLVLQGPPVGNPTTLLDIYPTYEHGLRLSKSSMQIYDDLHDEAKSFSGVAAYDNFLPATLGGQVEPERVWGQSATTNFFEVAQLPMTLGRGFYAGEDRSPVMC